MENWSTDLLREESIFLGKLLTCNTELEHILGNIEWLVLVDHQSVVSKTSEISLAIRVSIEGSTLEESICKGVYVFVDSREAILLLEALEGLVDKVFTVVSLEDGVLSAGLLDLVSGLLENK